MHYFNLFDSAVIDSDFKGLGCWTDCVFVQMISIKYNLSFVACNISGVILCCFVYIMKGLFEITKI